jgi:hypothetical protein
VSKTLSPQAIVAGMEVDYAKYCKLEFGQYVQTHKESDNSMNERTTGALALRPTGNQQGGYNIFSLTSSRRLNRSAWTPLPMPNDIIDRVHILARHSRIHRGLSFLDRNGQPFLDNDSEDDSDDEYLPDGNDDYAKDELFSDDDLDASIAGVPIAPGANIAGVTADNDTESED